LEVYDCFNSETGALVGLISEVGTNWATVLTLVDTDTSLDAPVFRTNDLGLAQGNFSLMGENRLRLEYLPVDCSLLGGDLVVTSGLGGFYPAGLVIGSVAEVQQDDSGTTSYAILTPAVEFDALSEVFVIRSFDPGY
jgi:rod shape-determining protein MreC